MFFTAILQGHSYNIGHVLQAIRFTLDQTRGRLPSNVNGISR
jgi:hypothetical protein